VKVSVYHGNGVTLDTDFRWVGAGRDQEGELVFEGYHTQNSTEYKATVRFNFEEALGLIERLKAQLNSMPCPTCRRKA